MIKRKIVSRRGHNLRDSGLFHALLGIETLDAQLAHPIAGAAWEGTVVEHLLTHAPERAQPLFYRTVAGAELELMLETPAGLAPNRTLIGQMVKRDIPLRYRGAMFGVPWIFLSPLLMLAIFVFVFGHIFQARWPEQREGLPFWVILYCGLISSLPLTRAL